MTNNTMTNNNNVQKMIDDAVEEFRQKVAFRPETLLPDIDLQTSGDEN